MSYKVFKLMMQFYSYIFDEHNPDLLNMIPECRVNFKSNLKSEHYTVIKLMIAWFGIFPLFPKSDAEDLSVRLYPIIASFLGGVDRDFLESMANFHNLVLDKSKKRLDILQSWK